VRNPFCCGLPISFQEKALVIMDALVFENELKKLGACSMGDKKQ